MKQKFGNTFTEIEKSIKGNVAKYKEKLQVIKIKKNRRDTEDYQSNEVCTWDMMKQQLPRSAMRAQSRAHTSTATDTSQRTRNNWQQGTRGDSSRESDFTLDSDSSISQSSGAPFLDNRGRQHRRRGADVASERQRQERRPWTRAYTKTW